MAQITDIKTPLKVTGFVIDDETYAIPDAAADQKGLMSAADYNKLASMQDGANATTYYYDVDTQTLELSGLLKIEQRVQTPLEEL